MIRAHKNPCTLNLENQIEPEDPGEKLNFASKVGVQEISIFGILFVKTGNSKNIWT